MSYFPLFTDLEKKKCLIAGGGRVALRKAKTLLDFGGSVTIAAPEICPEFENLAGITLKKELYRKELLDGVFLAVAATDDAELNHRISEDCKALNIPVNSATSKDDGTFIFPSVIRRGPLTVGVSSSGISPGASAEVRASLEAALPDNIGEILLSMEDCRSLVLKKAAPEKRGEIMRELYRAAVRKGSPLDEDETVEIIEKLNL